MEEHPVPRPSDGQVLVRVLYLSIDPYMRTRMSAAKSYATPVGIGEVMVGGTVASVIESRHPRFSAGDVVISRSGWQQYAISDGSDLETVEPSTAPLPAWLGVLGMPGFTAYVGLLKIGQPTAGETVVVPAATGPVGSVVGQIAKIHGARAVGIASGPRKCRALVEELGFHAAVDRTAADFPKQLAAACPQGVDVYFESVGGDVLRAVLPLLNDNARIPLCGLVSNYSGGAKSSEPDRSADLMTTFLVRRVTLRGFVISDFGADEPQFRRDMIPWLEAGAIKYREDLVDGLDAAPHALIGLLQGRNFGKVIVQVASDVTAPEVRQLRYASQVTSNGQHVR